MPNTQLEKVYITNEQIAIDGEDQEKSLDKMVNKYLWNMEAIMCVYLNAE